MEQAKIDRINELARKKKAEGLTDSDLSELEAHAYEVNRRIGTEALRNKHILFGV